MKIFFNTLFFLWFIVSSGAMGQSKEIYIELDEKSVFCSEAQSVVRLKIILRSEHSESLLGRHKIFVSQEPFDSQETCKLLQRKILESYFPGFWATVLITQNSYTICGHDCRTYRVESIRFLLGSSSFKSSVKRRII